MAQLFKPEEKKRGINKVFLMAAVIGIAVIGIAIWALSLRPSIDEQTTTILAGSYREGSSEFADLNKDIIISTDDKTIESPMATGKISMFINGKIRNKGTRTITVLEVNVSVVTQFNDILRERRILVVPVQQPFLGPGETIPITLTLDGFDKDDDRANIRWKVTAIKAQQLPAHRVNAHEQRVNAHEQRVSAPARKYHSGKETQYFGLNVMKRAS